MVRLGGVLVFAFLATVVSFAAIGIMKPSIDFATQVSVSRDVSQTLTIASDPERWQQWHAELDQVQYLRGPKSASGSFYRLIFRDADGERITTRQITAIDQEANELRFEDESSQITLSTNLMLQPGRDGGTLITADNVAESGEVFWHAYHWLLRDRLRQTQQRDLEALARLIETAEPAAPNDSGA